MRLQRLEVAGYALLGLGAAMIAASGVAALVVFADLADVLTVGTICGIVLLVVGAFLLDCA